MRKVVVDGQIYELPDGGDYVVMSHEMTPTARLEKRYTFPPRGGHEVRVQTVKYPVGWVENDLGNNAVPQPEGHEEIRHIMDFMYDNMYPNPYSKMKNKTRKKATRPPKSFFKSYASHMDKMREDYYNQPFGYEKERENQLRHAPTPGQRVSFMFPDGSKRRRIGTVVGSAQKLLMEMGAKSEARNYHPDSVVIATDDGSLKDYNKKSFFALTGDYHAWVAIKRDLRLISGEHEGDSSAWEGVPKHIGVFVPNSFEHDGVDFISGVTGRIIEINAGSGMVTVRWNFECSKFWTHEDTGTRNCFQVPLMNVQMARLKGIDGTLLQPWPLNPGKENPFKVGDLVEIHAGRHVSYCDPEGHEKLLLTGAIGKITAQYDPRTWQVKICGGVDPIIFDIEVMVRRDFMVHLQDPDSFYPRGTEVEICAEIDFRKAPLKGKRAKVILPTDTDGDIGLEFPEDLKAGSLDGVGKEGHCLYVEASAVKIPE